MIRARSEHLEQHPEIVDRAYRWPANPLGLAPGVQSLWKKVIFSPTPSGNKYLTISTNAPWVPVSVPGRPSEGNRWLMHNEDHVYAYAFALVANEDQAFGGKATESSLNIFIVISHRASRVLRATRNEETWHYIQQIKPTQLPNQSKLYSPSFLEESELFETIFSFLMSKSSLLAFI